MHGTGICVDCGACVGGRTKRCEAHAVAARRKAALKVVAARRASTPQIFALPDHAEIFWQQVALRMVARAIRHGYLPSLDGSVACADCAAPAVVYDHRDYAKPLDVAPVCARCNRLRGSALWPTRASFALVSARKVA